jgi:hypothetical protein
MLFCHFKLGERLACTGLGMGSGERTEREGARVVGGEEEVSWMCGWMCAFSVRRVWRVVGVLSTCATEQVVEKYRSDAVREL